MKKLLYLLLLLACAPVFAQEKQIDTNFPTNSTQVINRQANAGFHDVYNNTNPPYDSTLSYLPNRRVFYRLQDWIAIDTAAVNDKPGIASAWQAYPTIGSTGGGGGGTDSLGGDFLTEAQLVPKLKLHYLDDGALSSHQISNGLGGYNFQIRLDTNIIYTGHHVDSLLATLSGGGTDTTRVAKAGDTMTGDLQLNGAIITVHQDPTDPSENVAAVTSNSLQIGGGSDGNVYLGTNTLSYFLDLVERVRVDYSGLTFLDVAGTSGYQLRFATPSAIRTITFPNKSGTVAMLSDISGIPSGTAGGELSGTYPNPSLTNSGVRGKISVNAPLLYNSTTGVLSLDTSTVSTAAATHNYVVNTLFPTWNSSPVYAAGNRVVYSGQLWVKQDASGAGTQPGDPTTFGSWTPFVTSLGNINTISANPDASYVHTSTGGLISKPPSGLVGGELRYGTKGFFSSSHAGFFKMSTDSVFFSLYNGSGSPSNLLFTYSGGLTLDGSPFTTKTYVDAADANLQSEIDGISGFSGNFSDLSGVPTDLAGYGITDPIVLTSGSYANPSWITSLAASKLTGTTGVASGGTNIASYTIGDILYASGSTTLSKLAGVATGSALISGGTGTAPSWGKIGLGTHVSGTLPNANLATMATLTIKGNNTGGTASPSDLTAAQVKTLLAYSTTDVSEGTNLYFTDARVRTALLTGFSSSTGTVSSSDNVLQALQKINGNQAADAANIATNTSNISTNTTNITANTNAITLTQQSHTSGATVTVSSASGPIWLIMNPASVLASVTVTMPATPVDGQRVEISFGGTMTTGTVVTALTISPNTSQALLQATTPTTAEAGEVITYRWKSSVSIWYRLN